MTPADRQQRSRLGDLQPVSLKPFGRLEREALQRGIAVLDLNDPDLNPYLRDGARKYVEGRGEDPTNGDGYDIAALIRKWRKASTHTPFAVSVPNERVEDFRAAMRAMGVTVA